MVLLVPRTGSLIMSGHSIQPTAEIVEANFCDVDFDKILNTELFDFDRTATSAAWIQEVEDASHHYDHDDDDDDDDDDEHESLLVFLSQQNLVEGEIDKILEKS